MTTEIPAGDESSPAGTTDTPDSDAPASDAPARKQSRPKRVRPRWLRYTYRGSIAVAVTFLLLVGASIGSALTQPGTDSVAARLAEWGRGHGMSGLITWGENQQYQHHKPAVGGALTPAERQQLAGGTPPPSALPALDAPAAITPIVSPALPGEGSWQVLASNGARPLVMRAVLRPDPLHTSYLAYVAWIDASKARFVLHPGTQEPGHGPWPQAATIPTGQRTGLLATFNSGFRLQDALIGPYGGYLADGRTIGKLQNGSAAMIFRADGSMTIGKWGRDGTTADRTIVAVRENLRLLVDHGRVQADAMDGSGQTWGYTVKNAYYVWRSGVGVTANGDIVYAMGPTLSVQTLAQMLQRAGAVTAMELDINPDWVSFMSYQAAGQPSNPTPVKLASFSKPADRYYRISSRDFIAVYAR